jgi:hypothetical protein
MMGGPLPAAAFQQPGAMMGGMMGGPAGMMGPMGGMPASPQYAAQQQQQQQQRQQQQQQQQQQQAYGGFMAGPGAQPPALQMSGMPTLGAGGLMGGYPPKAMQGPLQQQQQMPGAGAFGGLAPQPGYGAPAQYGLGGVGSPAAQQAAINAAFNFKF